MTVDVHLGLLAMRRRHGRFSPVGKKVDLLLGQLRNHARAEGETRTNLAWLIQGNVEGLAKLTADSDISRKLE